MTLHWLTAAVIAAAVLVGTARLLLWRRASRVDTPLWRLGALAGLQMTAAVLLYLTLNPPATVVGAAALRVVTPGQVAEAGPGEIPVALPESDAVDVVRVPDLATALRRFPEAQSIRVSGDGLPPRDQGALPVPLEYEPGPAPVGLVEFSSPSPVAPGAGFEAGGRVGTLASGVVELVDPADQVVARAPVEAGDQFQLTAYTRAAGLALFHLRLRDAQGDLVEEIAVPVETRDAAAIRMVVLAGAPNPEVRQVRRWAESVELDVSLQVDLGAGLRLGDAAPLTAAGLSEVDLLVIDDRRWETLPGASRAAVASAVRSGMGLLLRPTGPLGGETRRQWAALGVSLSGAGDAVAPPDESEALTRLDLTHDGSAAVSILLDDQEAVTASWSGLGLGRVGVITVVDTYALALTGRPEQHSRIWGAVVSALARADDQARPEIEGLAWSGRRVAVCDLQDEGRVIDPTRAAHSLIIDPGAGARRCAAWWPETAGWHVAVDDRDQPTPFYVHPADAASSLLRAADRQATLNMAAATPDADAHGQRRVAGSPWPWFTALLAVLALLWWLERRRPRQD
ncbi:MAG: hypothetical protein C0461_06935 [Brevundimonas sp.]|nr:hypothetical protein [Brevundimonas sp.]